MAWDVYILECADNTLYTGITTDINRRINEHNGEGKKPGAKYTCSRRPVSLVYTETCTSRSFASKREIEIKSLKRSEKLNLIAAKLK